MAVHVQRKQVWVLVGVFFAPLLLAFVLYYGNGWRPAGGTNHGDLIDPPRPLPAVELASGEGEKLPAGVWQGKWSVVYVGDGSCDQRCREALTLMRQTRLALNDDMQRIQRIFVASGNCCDRAYLEAEHAGLITARGDDEAGTQLLATFPDNAALRSAGRIYIVDPLGNLMMRYEPDAPAKALLEDLKKLLKLSHIG